ncbi:MAG: SIR2 family protein [bacterium]
MPFDASAIPQRLVEAARVQNLVPLVGAGISHQAGDVFPGWNAFLKQMKERAVANKYVSATEGEELEQLIDGGKPLMAAEALRYSLPGDEYESILEEKFDPPDVHPAEVHKALFRLNPPMILTTNYDRLLEDAYAEEFKRSVKVLTYRDAVTAQRFLQSGRVNGNRPIVFKIHGTIDEPEGIVLSERDYRHLVYRQPGYRLVLSAIFLTKVILMLGFSFADPELRLLLEGLRESLKNRSHPDYIFLPKSAIGAVESRRLRDDFGVQVITYDPSPGHQEVLQLINFLIKCKEQKNSVST